MKTLVIGLGALGTVYSCLLSLAGHEVTGLSRPASIVFMEKGSTRFILG